MKKRVINILVKGKIMNIIKSKLKRNPVGKDMDFYEMLGVSRNATAQEIKEAWKKISKTLHPDVGGNEEEFKTVKNAYETLIDPKKRDNYDLYGADNQQYELIIKACVDIFNHIIEQDPNNIEKALDKYFENSYGEIGNTIRSSKREIEKYEKQFKRIKKAPKNNFLGNAIKDKIKGVESKISQVTTHREVFKSAQRLLHEYIFEERPENIYEEYEDSNKVNMGHAFDPSDCTMEEAMRESMARARRRAGNNGFPGGW